MSVKLNMKIMLLRIFCSVVEDDLLVSSGTRAFQETSWRQSVDWASYGESPFRWIYITYTSILLLTTGSSGSGSRDKVGDWTPAANAGVFVSTALNGHLFHLCHWGIYKQVLLSEEIVQFLFTHDKFHLSDIPSIPEAVVEAVAANTEVCRLLQPTC